MEVPERAEKVTALLALPGVLVIVDECHETSLRKSMLALKGLESSPACWVGLTATPDSKGRKIELGDVYRDLVCGPNYRTLIDTPDPLVSAAYGSPMGALVETDYRIMRTRIDTSQATVGADGEWEDDSLAVAAMDPAVMRAVVDAWQLEAIGQRSVAFCCTVEHALALGRVFADDGIPVAITTGTAKNTGLILPGGGFKRLKRAEIDRLLADGDVWVLMTVAALGKGWDLPEVEVMVDCKPLLQSGTWYQEVGRIKRVCARTQKRLSICLDFAGNVGRHGRLEWILDWKLPKGHQGKKSSKKWKEPAALECPDCKAVFPVGTPYCEVCGFLFPLPEKPPPPKGLEYKASDAWANGYIADVGQRVRGIPVFDLGVREKHNDEWGDYLYVWGRADDGRYWSCFTRCAKDWVFAARKLTGTVKHFGTWKDGTPKSVLTRVVWEP
jgi:hypothetical protein